MKMKTVNLDDIDGYEFEKVCKNIFSSLNFGQVEITPSTGDMGKDLIIHSPEGTILVECKHHTRSSIGRPVIQKFHSALISDNAIKGYVVTTGKFSDNAIVHAKSLHPPIELIDRGLLLDLASKAGIEFVTSEGKASVYSFPISNKELITKNIIAYINAKLISKPNSIQSIIELKTKKVRMRPIYKIEYKIDADFSTSVGLIHSEYSSGNFFIEGDKGNIDESLSYYFHNIQVTDYVITPGKNRTVVPFRILSGQIKDRAMNHIIEKHTKYISYTGGNNQRYTKECIPKRKDIYISDISQIYVPDTQIGFVLNKRNRNIYFSDNGTPHFQVYTENISNCEICSHHLYSRGILCNDCGGISHDKKFFDSHGFYCKKCGMSLCRNCTKYFVKYLFLKVPVCRKCGSKESKNGKRVRKFPRL
jgi:restriction system protein